MSEKIMVGIVKGDNSQGEVIPQSEARLGYRG